MSEVPSDQFDAIVVGGGHNGLVCAAYLARAGRSVLMLEARETVGGCAGTDHAVGAKVNLCNCDHAMVRTVPLVEELRLAEFGLEYIDLTPSMLGLGWDAPGPIAIFHDVEQTLEVLAVSHPSEVDNYRRYAKVAVPAARLLTDMASTPPSASGLLQRAIGRNSRAAITLAQWSRRSVGDVLRGFFDADGLLGPAMAAGPAVWGLSPETPGTGLGALPWAFKHVLHTGRPVGGSGALTDAIAASLESMNGTVMTGAPVASILCEGDAVVGVDTTDGRSFRAPTVVVACDPREAIVRYLSNPPTSAGGFISKWRDREPQEGYESKIDARISTVPTWKYHDERYVRAGLTDPASASTLVAPSLAEIHRGFGLMQKGEILERPMLFVNVPSINDPTLAPPGEHVLSMEVLYTPYSFTDGWDDASEPERWIDVASKLFAPGFTDSIVEWRAMTPAVYERELHLPKGHATSFAGGPLAAILGRDRELTRYITPIDGLFLTGAATFPGAGVWGASGRNAASVIIDRTN